MFVRGVLCCAIFVFRNDRFGRGVSLIKIAKKKIYVYIKRNVFIVCGVLRDEFKCNLVF